MLLEWRKYMYLCCCCWRHKTSSAILCFDLIEIDVLIRFVSNYTRVHVFSIYCSVSTHASTITKFLLNFLLHSRLTFGHVCQSCLFTRGALSISMNEVEEKCPKKQQAVFVLQPTIMCEHHLSACIIQRNLP